MRIDGGAPKKGKGGGSLTWNLVNVRGNTLVGDLINMWFIAVSLLPSLALETETARGGTWSSTWLNLGLGHFPVLSGYPRLAFTPYFSLNPSPSPTLQQCALFSTSRKRNIPFQLRRYQGRYLTSGSVDWHSKHAVRDSGIL